jgi:hypothetical protein
MQILTGHISPETAYTVADYPYGFRLRCQMRYWIEVHPKHGCRMMSQTSNPKRPGLVWNTAKASTYSRFGMAIYLDDAGHVQQSGLHEYIDHAKVPEWVETYGPGVPEAARPLMCKWLAAVTAYAARKAA